ncbi:DUF4253 domain-containing protein [Acetonema longum]|uniref:DUF4253 domain-containing protein n=1 Tax=Acetonema longum DSM 6540 TaxID=1009370 RepID=F7NJH7_9FIRM|nr:DUF4253 domain-containing protein [Acetonema longum]EGO63807.1 hypothetical protein ALO_11164 [Acetonema longum DSM 6540]
MTECGKAIIDFLGCEYELFENETSENNLINRWDALTELGKREGFFPLLIVSSDTLVEKLEFVFDDFDVENTPEGIAAYRQNVIADSKRVDVTTFLSGRLDEYLEMHTDDNIWGELLPCEPNHCFYCPLEGEKLHSELIIAKVPAQNPWELAAWIPMGGFNDCPSPAEQVAVFRHWYKKYGAVPCVVTHDNWELELANPPRTDEAAEELAKEHFAFCYDIVMQAARGWDTIRARASTLKNSTTWYFWWD